MNFSPDPSYNTQRSTSFMQLWNHLVEDEGRPMGSTQTNWLTQSVHAWHMALLLREAAPENATHFRKERTHSVRTSGSVNGLWARWWNKFLLRFMGRSSCQWTRVYLDFRFHQVLTSKQPPSHSTAEPWMTVKSQSECLWQLQSLTSTDCYQTTVNCTAGGKKRCSDLSKNRRTR
jgi:hypothetical protein